MTLIAMSGGVDSSVTAKLILDKGERCIGCTMCLFDDGSGRFENDTFDSAAVCSLLGIPYYTVDLQKEFSEKIINKFVDSYLMGQTPNPCVECNRCIKFGLLFDVAEKLNCNSIATGHYARITNENGLFQLRKALDLTKDQSYFLYNLTQEKLSRISFPLGDFKKTEIRQIASCGGFVNASRSDSQDICFVPNSDYISVIKKIRPAALKKSVFMDKNGKKLGVNDGILNFTVGQRRGLNLAMGVPYYVTRIDSENNIVYVGEREETYFSDFTIDRVNWISGRAPAENFKCNVRIRYLHREAPAQVIVQSDKCLIRFDEPQHAVTPGQSAVMYEEDVVLGGGIIENVL